MNIPRPADKSFSWNLAAKSDWILALEMLRFTLMATLILWWGYLLWHLASTSQVALLDLGVKSQDFKGYNNVILTKRMIFGESVAIILLLILSSCSTLWLYMRDIKRLRSIETFFAAMTHELRTPLAGIYLQAQMMNDTIGDEDKQRKYSERLLADVSRLDSQVEKIIEVARVIRGSKIREETVDLVDVFDKAYQQLPNAYKDVLTLTAPKEPVLIAGDSYLVQIIFRNLLENSAKHGKKQEIAVSLTAETRGKKTIVTYADTGVGLSIDAAEAGKSLRTGKDGKGSGVGLFLINSLIKSMNGSVRFANDNGLKAVLTFDRKE